MKQLISHTTACLFGLMLMGHATIAFPDVIINEISFGEWRFTSGDGIYGIGWIELKNISENAVNAADLYLSTDTDPAWRLPNVTIPAGAHYFIWLSGKDTTFMEVPHASILLSDSSRFIKLVHGSNALMFDSVSIYAPPIWNGTYGRCEDGGDEWCYFTSPTPGSANLTLGLWQNVATQAQFSPRDSSPNAALYFKSKHWILEGWVGGGGESASFSNSWSSNDGLYWTLENGNPPYDPYSGFVVFKDKMWAFSDTSYNSDDGIIWTEVAANHPFGRHCRVVEFKDHLFIVKEKSIWKSADGITWNLLTDDAPWQSREFPAFLTFKDRLWLFGGGTGYNTGEDKYFNDVWVSDNGIHWDLAAEHVEWDGRYWFGFASFDNKMWMLGGWNYHDKGDNYYGNKNDVWYSEDGVFWQQLHSSNIWRPRHAPFVWVDEQALWVSSGYLNTTGLMNDVWKIEKFQNIVTDKYYLRSGEDPAILASWGTSENGTGTPPKEFTSDFQQFVLCNSDTIRLTSHWTVSGTNSSVVIGLDDNPLYFYVADTARLDARVKLNNKTLLSLADSRNTEVVESSKTSELILRQHPGQTHLMAYSVGQLTIQADSVALLSSPTVKRGIVFSGNTVLSNGSQFSYDPHAFLEFNSADKSPDPSILWPKVKGPTTVILNMIESTSLYDNMQIDSLEFLSGMLEIKSGTLKVNTFSGESSRSYIITGENGQLEVQRRNDSFFFPFGTQHSYNPMRVTLQNETITKLSASVHEIDTLKNIDQSVNVAWQLHSNQNLSFHAEVSWEPTNIGQYADEQNFALTVQQGNQWVKAQHSNVSTVHNNSQSISGYVNGHELLVVQNVLLKDRDSPLVVHPNPSSGELNITMQQRMDEGTQIVIHDLTGKIKMKMSVEKAAHSISLKEVSSLPAGSYILSIKTGGKIYTRQVIII